MATPRRRWFAEALNAFLASLFLIALGFASGVVLGIAKTEEVTAAQVASGYLSVASHAYRVTPIRFEEHEQ